MAITKTYNSNEFARELSDYGDFSYEAALAISEYLEGIGMAIEFDPIAFRCDFSEYDDLEEALEATGAESLDDLENTTWCEVLYDGSVVVIDI